MIWRTKRTLRPGAPGTLHELEAYGDALVCVRYRYDAAGERRMKTVELVVEEGPVRRAVGVDAERVVGVRVPYGQHVLAQAIIVAGGLWDARDRLWRLAFDAVVGLGLERLIVEPVRDDVAYRSFS